MSSCSIFVLVNAEQMFMPDCEIRGALNSSTPSYRFILIFSTLVEAGAVLSLDILHLNNIETVKEKKTSVSVTLQLENFVLLTTDINPFWASCWSEVWCWVFYLLCLVPTLSWVWSQNNKVTVSIQKPAGSSFCWPITCKQNLNFIETFIFMA